MSRSLLYKVNGFHDKVAQEFVLKYYCSDDNEHFEGTIHCQENEDSGSMNYWYAINDDMWNINDMYTALWYGIPYSTLFAWFDIQCGNVSGPKVNLLNYYKYIENESTGEAEGGVC